MSYLQKRGEQNMSNLHKILKIDFDLNYFNPSTALDVYMVQKPTWLKNQLFSIKKKICHKMVYITLPLGWVNHQQSRFKVKIRLFKKVFGS